MTEKPKVGKNQSRPKIQNEQKIEDWPKLGSRKIENEWKNRKKTKIKIKGKITDGQKIETKIESKQKIVNRQKSKSDKNRNRWNITDRQMIESGQNQK